MSNKELVSELFRQNQAILEKSAFMLITASTASIAYILSQLKGETWSGLIWLVICSLILLASSFIIGCVYLTNQAKLLNVNSKLLQPEFYKNDYDKLFKIFTSIYKKAEIFSRWQFLSFIFGAAYYAIYVLLRIYFKL